MIRSILAVAALVAGASVAIPAAEAQTTPPAEGRRCSFASVADPTLEGDAQTGDIDGGPLVADAPSASVSMKCTIQVGAANAAHNGTDSCAVEAGVTLQSTAVAGTCTYESPDGFPVYICTEITINGVTWYWDNNPPGTGTWVQSSAAACAEAIRQEVPYIRSRGAFGDVLSWDVDTHGSVTIESPTLDTIFCSISSSLAGTYSFIIITPEGDIYIDFDHDGIPDPDELSWDCPPTVRK